MPFGLFSDGSVRLLLPHWGGRGEGCRIGFSQAGAGGRVGGLFTQARFWRQASSLDGLPRLVAFAAVCHPGAQYPKCVRSREHVKQH